MSRLIPFQKLNNVRDLGGMKTKDGRKIRSGRLIRSGHLSSLTPADTDLLKRLADRVIDFRTQAECEENPDTIIDGIEYTSMPILDTLTPGVTREKDADRKVFISFLTKPREAKEYMRGLYQSFTMEHAIRQYARFLKILMEGSRKAILWHCTAGKDRAGIASALIEEILGVSREDIIADYLATNDYLKGETAFLTGFVKKQAGIEDNAAGRIADEALKNLFETEETYIDAFYDSVDQKYGGFDRFVTEGLGLSKEEVIRLRMQYLE